MPQIIEIGWHSTKLLQKHKGAVFLRHSVCITNKCIGDHTKAAARQSPNCIKNTKKKYAEKRFLIWRIELLHPAMWHVALESWQWIHQVSAPCNVILGSGMTCHGIRSNVCHIRILHLVLSLTISPQLTRHSAPVCKILSTSDHPEQKKMTSCRFSRCRISAILDFRGPIMGSLKSPCTTSYIVNRDHSSKLLSFWENHVFAIWRQTDRQTNRRTDGHARRMKPLSLSQAAA